MSHMTLGVYAYGFERPSAIQQRAIMPVIKGMFDTDATVDENRTLINYRI